MQTLIFDQNSLYYSENAEHNLAFIRALEQYLQCVCKVEGLIKLNKIYEAFGLCGSQEAENVCIKCNDKLFYQFHFEVFQGQNGSLYINIVTPENGA